MIPLGVLASGYVAPAAAASFTYQGSVAAFNNVTVPIGTESPSRQVIVALSFSQYQAAPVTVTIGGAAATVDLDAYEYSGVAYRPHVAIARATVPTGTSAVVTVSGSGVMRDGATHVWTTEQDIDAVGSGSVFPVPGNLSLLSDNSGFAVGAGYVLGGGYGPVSFSNMDEDFGSSSYASSGQSAVSAATGGPTLSSSLSGGRTNYSMGAVVTYAPAGGGGGVEAITDNFGTLSSSWAIINGAWEVPSNSLRQGTNTVGDSSRKYVYHTDHLSSADHYAEARLLSSNSIGSRGLLIRLNDATGEGDITGYMVDMRSGTISKVMSGVVTTLASASLPDPGSSVVHRFAASGTALTYYRDGVLQNSVTDSSIRAGTHIGFWSVRDSTFDDLNAQVQY